MPVSFTRLRIAGFKSFADPVVVELLPGLTGIVGPNGCGKSNVVEALRWVMGENSARSMRGGEMDDVIFAGTAHRASRNLAEVSLMLEDALGLAPAPLDQEAELQISRRIERGAGSAYRINGKEARARDVQTLFADLASGARSSAMVSQGRIGALVNARPDDRRAILEEAAGITGLHARRHEAELKLRAAETNLARAEDLKGQLDSQLDSLKKQARQAARYRNISGLVRDAEAEWLSLLTARADAALTAARQSLHQARQAVRDAEFEAAEAASRAEAAELALDDPRALEATARSTLERRRVETEGLEQEEARARQELEQAEHRRAQLQQDLLHAEAMDTDAQEAEARLQAEADALRQAEQDLPDRIVAAEATLAELVDAAQEVSRQADHAAELAAEAHAKAQQAQSSLNGAQDRARRITAQYDRLVAERDNAEAARIPAELMEMAEAEFAAAETALSDAHLALEQAEQARTAAAAQHADIRRELAAAETAHQAAETELAEEQDRFQAIAAQRDSLQAEYDSVESGRVGPEHLRTTDSERESAELGLAEAQAALEMAEKRHSEAMRQEAESSRVLAERESAHQRAENLYTEAAARAARIGEQYRAMRAEHETAQQALVPDHAMAEARQTVRTGEEFLTATRVALENAETSRSQAAAALAEARRAMEQSDALRTQAEADHRTAQARMDRLAERHAALAAEWQQAQAQSVPAAQLQAARNALADAEMALEQATSRLRQAETQRADRARCLADATQQQNAAEAGLTRLLAEIEGLNASLRTQSAAVPVADSIAVPAGLEQAVGAALGDSLDSALDQTAAHHWRLLPNFPLLPLPQGAQPLAELIEAPPELARALAYVGLIPDDRDGGQMLDQLQPGQILVSRDGGAWRWDGHITARQAETPAARRLEQRNKLHRAEAQRPDLEQAAEQARTARHQAELAVQAAETEEAAARQQRDTREAALQSQRQEEAQLSTRAARADSQLAAIAAQQQQLDADQADATAALHEAEARRAAIPAPAALRATLDEAETADRAAAVQAAQARAARQDAETALQSAREALAAIAARHAEAESRISALGPQLQRLAQEQAEAEQALAETESARASLPSIIQARDAAEAAMQAVRLADDAQNGAREARRVAAARLETARARHAECAARAAEAEARLAALQPQIERLAAEQAQALQRLDRARAAQQALPALDMLRSALDAASAAERDANQQDTAAREGRRAAELRLAESRAQRTRLAAQSAEIEGRLAALLPQLAHQEEERQTADAAVAAAQLVLQEVDNTEALRATLDAARVALSEARWREAEARGVLEGLRGEDQRLAARLQAVLMELDGWTGRRGAASARLADLRGRLAEADQECGALAARPDAVAERRAQSASVLAEAEAAHAQAAEVLHQAERAARDTAEARRAAETIFATARESQARLEGAESQALAALQALAERVTERLGEGAVLPQPAELSDVAEDKARRKLDRLTRERDEMGPVNLRAEIELEELEARIAGIEKDRDELQTAIAKLRGSIGNLNREGRERLTAVFEQVDRHFQTLFARMFGGGKAHLGLVGSDDPLLAGLEIYAQPPGKKLSTLSLLSGGEQALTALSLIFAVFRCNPAPVCVLDEVDAPLDDANVDRFCALLNDVVQETGTRFLVVTHHQLTMSRMDRLYGVTMQERGISRLLSVDLARAAEMVNAPRVAAE